MSIDDQKKQLHFTLFTFPPFVHHYPDEWRHPLTMVSGAYNALEPAIWNRVAHTLSDMKVDAFFVGDGGAVYNRNQNSPASSLRYGSQSIEFFAPAMAAHIAATAPDLGVVSTINTEELNPWTLARMVTSIDHLTQGRIGINYVTGLNPGGLAENLGAELREHDTRYDRAEEFIQVCYQLWASWENDALVMDSKAPMFADPEKVHEINFSGEWFNCRGPMSLPRSPQQIPAMFQAGQSPKGRQFAAKHAEGVFTIHPDLLGMRDYYTDMKERIVQQGRKETDCVILPGIFPIVGTSESEAEDKYQALLEVATPEAGLSWISGYGGFDFSQVSLNTPLSELNPDSFAGIQSIFGLTMARSPDAADLTPYIRSYPYTESPTVYDLAMANAQSIVPKVVGTAEQVADQLEDIVDKGGADGFMFSTVHVPGSIDEMAMVIAELQRRGRYRREYEGPTLRERLGTRPLPWA